jgi:hypothetical protein
LEIERGIQEQNVAFLAAAQASLNAGATAAAAVAAAQADKRRELTAKRIAD